MAASMKDKRPYTRKEEFANAITHGVGLALAIAALSVLATFSAQGGDVWRVVSLSVYGASLVLLYTTSTLYHAFPWPGLKRLLNRLDHAAIFVLIAGSYTPFALVTMRGAWGWTIFGLVWGITLVGVYLEVFHFKRFPKTELALYLAMGWIIVVAVKPMFAAMPVGGMFWLGAGGLCYTGGVVFYVWHSLPYHHAIWHLFVLAGSLLHFFGIYHYVLPLKGAI